MDQTEPTPRITDPIGDPLPPYEPPRIVTYRGQDILRMMGPIQACSFGHSVVACGPSFYSTAPWEHGRPGDH
ncbi:MAG: hypothetical protein ACP5UQ_06925 [Anaerolineae bacterium]